MNTKSQLKELFRDTLTNSKNVLMMEVHSTARSSRIFESISLDYAYMISVVLIEKSLIILTTYLRVRCTITLMGFLLLARCAGLNPVEKFNAGLLLDDLKPSSINKVD